MSISRRQLIKMAASSAVMSQLPFNQAMAQTAPTTLNGKTLVVVFMRGGADGLQLVAPIGDAVSDRQYNAYSKLRVEYGSEQIGLARGDVDFPSYMQLTGGFPLSGQFVLNPALMGFEQMWQDNQLAVIHAVGGTESRSHFSAMDAMEWGAPINQPESSYWNKQGWLHNCLRALSAPNGYPSTENMFAAGVGLGNMLPRSLEGVSELEHILAINSLAEFRFTAGGHYGSYLPLEKELLIDNYEREANKQYHKLIMSSGNNTMRAENIAESIPSRPSSAGYATNSDFSKSLQNAASMIMSNTAPAIITLDIGGWDTHDNMASRVSGRAADLNSGLQTFYNDLKTNENGIDYRSEVCTVVMTEFGRTLDPNGNKGADHGKGGAAFIIGGGVTPGVHGAWPKLPSFVNDDIASGIVDPISDPSNPEYDNDAYASESGRWHLKPVNDYRSIYLDIMEDFLDISSADADGMFGYSLAQYNVSKLGLFS